MQFDTASQNIISNHYNILGKIDCHAVDPCNIIMTKDGKRIGLALSGGGYRAAAYHIGTLRALHNMGILDKVDVISSVSGGSIIAAYYALHKEDFDHFEQEMISKLNIGVLHLVYLNLVAILTAVALLTWCLKLPGLIASLVILFVFWYQLFPTHWWLRLQFDWLFFHKKTLSDLPESPKVTINTTDYPTVSQFVFSHSQIYGYYYGSDAFYHSQFPISLAVTTSTCVPFAFRPVRIPSKYQTSKMKMKRQPMLLDGGLYDNQGTHVLTDKSSNYQCDYIIVSDAGNGKVTDKFTLNPLLALYKTSEVFMQRIKKFQSQQNLYLPTYPDKRFAYVVLEWDYNERILDGFVRNLLEGHVHADVCSCHQIPDADIADLTKVHRAAEATVRIKDRLKRNIHWDEFLAIQPTVNSHKSAYKTLTDMTFLRKSRIADLIRESEWKTQMQVRLYLPFMFN